jgi:hypothetical protein
MKVTIEAQVEALEDVVKNHRSYVALVKRLVARNERPKEILEDTEARLPLIEASLRTLKWVKENRELIIQMHEKLKKAS